MFTDEAIDKLANIIIEVAIKGGQKEINLEELEQLGVDDWDTDDCEDDSL
jgi:hypothetical protein